MTLVYMMHVPVTPVGTVNASVLQLLPMHKNVSKLKLVYSGGLLIYAVSIIYYIFPKGYMLHPYFLKYLKYFCYVFSDHYLLFW